MQFIVTVKLPKQATHNPQNKISGLCPVGDGNSCTDTTGQHHSFLLTAPSLADVNNLVVAKFDNIHITRIERV